MNVIIPARFGSSRLPGKPLADVAGKPLIEHVYQRAQESGARRIVIATDDARIQRVAEGFGATVCMTSTHHPSGTDRLGEVIERLQIGPDEIVVNLQGDEPLMRPNLIREVGEALDRHRDAVVATACYPIREKGAFTNPNIVKVVCDARGYAMYFSRAPIPWPRARMAEGKNDAVDAMHHIGLYAYRAGFVGRYCAWGPCPPEQAEQLEQLRVLWHGERIFVCATERSPGAGVDTPEDLERVRAHFVGRATK
jgi:3-deoxy-manno-octulosonate cytidylyltransferase (CMP-KDO synthetase)